MGNNSLGVQETSDTYPTMPHIVSDHRSPSPPPFSFFSWAGIELTDQPFIKMIIVIKLEPFLLDCTQNLLSLLDIWAYHTSSRFRCILHPRTRLCGMSPLARRHLAVPLAAGACSIVLR